MWNNNSPSKYLSLLINRRKIELKSNGIYMNPQQIYKIKIPYLQFIVHLQTPRNIKKNPYQTLHISIHRTLRNPGDSEELEKRESSHFNSIVEYENAGISRKYNIKIHISISGRQRVALTFLKVQIPRTSELMNIQSNRNPIAIQPWRFNSVDQAERAFTRENAESITKPGVLSADKIVPLRVAFTCIDYFNRRRDRLARAQRERDSFQPPRRCLKTLARSRFSSRDKRPVTTLRTVFSPISYFNAGRALHRLPRSIYGAVPG